MPVEYRVEGRYITAQDVADRLMPDLYMNEVLLWAPDLFAYTSYLMSMTSAYQLVVSPPSGKTWQPNSEDIRKWLFTDTRENLEYWFKKAVEDWGCEKGYDAQSWIEKAITDVKDYELNHFADNKGRKRTAKSKTGKTSIPSITWSRFVKEVGDAWRQRLDTLTEVETKTIDDTEILKKNRREFTRKMLQDKKKTRGQKLLKIVLEHTPPILLATWAYFYVQATNPKFNKGYPIHISDLLCNQDDMRTVRNVRGGLAAKQAILKEKMEYRNRMWDISQALITMHAIADLASVQLGIVSDTRPRADKVPNEASRFAERLLFGREKGIYVDTAFHSGGSLSTFNTERVRVLPKRHNPSVGITLRSISSNLAFHQSSVDVVWRKTINNKLGDRMTITPEEKISGVKLKKKISILLLPFPLSVKTNDFSEDISGKEQIILSENEHSFFKYDPKSQLSPSEKEDVEEEEIDRAIKLIIEAHKEQAPKDEIDIVIFPETALSIFQFNKLKTKLESHNKKHPSIIIAGVRESKKEIIEDLELEVCGAPLELNFPRNAVYCKYYNSAGAGSYDFDPTESQEVIKKTDRTPRFKQYKHHRWQLSASQIRRYGLSSVLDIEQIWWESIKIPKRRVSFLNVGDRLTISHLICEDLARQDPIAELIRHVGPSLVVAILMDGPQLKNRWSARYATVLADDPGCSVITLTSIGMVKRHISEFGLMSQVIALWNESGSSNCREIELTQGAEAVLLTLEIKDENEMTADGRREEYSTSTLKLLDVIQIYPPKK